LWRAAAVAVGALRIALSASISAADILIIEHLSFDVLPLIFEREPEVD
jgi:hypothetical protein